MASLSSIHEDVKSIVDVSSLTAGVAVFMSMLPEITLTFTAIWAVLRVYDSWLSIKERKKRLKESSVKEEEVSEDVQ